MRAAAREFTSQIELPCTLSCGENGDCKLIGTAVRIESTRLVLRIRKAAQTLPRVGEQVRLNVHLPAQAGISAKDLTVRARIIEASDARQGVQTFVVSFRRAQFKDRNQASAPKKVAAAAAVKWEM